MDEWMNIFRDIPLFKPIRHSQSEERERKKKNNYRNETIIHSLP